MEADIQGKCFLECSPFCRIMRVFSFKKCSRHLRIVLFCGYLIELLCKERRNWLINETHFALFRMLACLHNLSGEFRCEMNLFSGWEISLATSAPQIHVLFDGKFLMVLPSVIHDNDDDGREDDNWWLETYGQWFSHHFCCCCCWVDARDTSQMASQDNGFSLGNILGP